MIDWITMYEFDDTIPCCNDSNVDKGSRRLRFPDRMKEIPISRETFIPGIGTYRVSQIICEKEVRHKTPLKQVFLSTRGGKLPLQPQRLEMTHWLTGCQDQEQVGIAVIWRLSCFVERTDA